MCGVISAVKEDTLRTNAGMGGNCNVIPAWDGDTKQKLVNRSRKMAKKGQPNVSSQ